MEKIIYHVKSDTREIIEATPHCRADQDDVENGDFCDGCGDCLVCHVDLFCYANGTPWHVWVEYDWNN